jgi:hypothetical protein
MTPESSCIWTPPISNEKIISYNNTRLSAFNYPRAFMNPPLSDKIQTNFAQPILLVEPNVEEQMANNWNNEVRHNGTRREFETLDWHTRRFPDRPWLLGVSYDVNADSNLKNLGWYNDRDCITNDEFKTLERLELDASIRIMKQNNQNFDIYPTLTKQWFDNNTRVKTLRF